MNIKMTALAIAGLAVMPVTAFAQSAPAPINQHGPGVSAPVSSSTDMGIAGVSGNTYPAPGGIYAARPRAVVVEPGYESYAAAVPGSDYAARGHYTAPYGGPTVGYGAYGGPAVGYGGYAEVDED